MLLKLDYNYPPLSHYSVIEEDSVDLAVEPPNIIELRHIKKCPVDLTLLLFHLSECI